MAAETTGGVGGKAAAVWVATMAAVPAASGGKAMVGAGVGEAGGVRVAAGVGNESTMGWASGPSCVGADCWACGSISTDCEQAASASIATRYPMMCNNLYPTGVNNRKLSLFGSISPDRISKAHQSVKAGLLCCCPASHAIIPETTGTRPIIQKLLMKIDNHPVH